jgi:phosphosulfolactate phosphohydrolase-like enzyme
MARTTPTITEKLQKLEQQKNDLIVARRNEIFKIIDATGSLSIDDRILAGALLFLKDEKNKDHAILKEFKSYLDKNKKTTSNRVVNNNSSMQDQHNHK